MRLIGFLIFLLCTAFVGHASAETICIKNKKGVLEAWETSDKNSSLVKSTENCGTQSTVSSIREPARQMPAAPVQEVSQNVLENSSSARAVQDWITSPEDMNMRLLIGKWSKSVGWTLVWNVDKDILLESADRTSGDFRTAVRKLLASTTLIDYTLKPCFYSNNVVRVVKETTKCNPNE